MGDRKLDAGSPEPLGVKTIGDGVNVAVFSAHATTIELCLFDDSGQHEIERIALPERTGDIFHGFIPDVSAGTRYGLRAHGPYAPKEGHRFNPAKLLIDPYARAIDRPFMLDPTMLGSIPGTDEADGRDSSAAMPKGIVLPSIVRPPSRILTPWDQTVLYELHVRGYTMLRDEIPPALRGTFAGLAQPASIEHLQRLGVTTVEIMPAAAWMQERHLAELGLPNYWGYNTIAFMAPDPRLAPAGWDGVRATVQALAQAGIETIADVVLNHSGEGNALGPTLSFRGLDNATYYRLETDDLAAYSDEAGCGNVLALNRPPVLRLAMDALRAWAVLGGIHGFRFDLASVLGRGAAGFHPSAPLLSAISQDPILRGLKLIAEPWDVGLGGYRVGEFPAAWGEWNDRFRDGMRRFWRGDATSLGEVATRLAGSSDLFGGKRRPSRSVNFVVAHDGFTLADLVSYKNKRNAANGEDNRDGADESHSWNNGVEGATADADILAKRTADQRALLALLLLSRGTPMLSMGAETGHSQNGNNNAYAQDNETSWVDWTKADQDLIDWTARLIRIRRKHPAFREDRFLIGRHVGSELPPDVVWLGPGGRVMQIDDWNAPDGAVLIMVLATPTENGADRVALAINRGYRAATIAMPQARPGHGWSVLADSDRPEAGLVHLDGPMTLPPRAVLVLGELERGEDAPVETLPLTFEVTAPVEMPAPVPEETHHFTSEPAAEAEPEFAEEAVVESAEPSAETVSSQPAAEIAPGPPAAQPEPEAEPLPEPEVDAPAEDIASSAEPEILAPEEASELEDVPSPEALVETVVEQAAVPPEPVAAEAVTEAGSAEPVLEAEPLQAEPIEQAPPQPEFVEDIAPVEPVESEEEPVVTAEESRPDAAEPPQAEWVEPEPSQPGPVEEPTPAEPVEVAAEPVIEVAESRPDEAPPAEAPGTEDRPPEAPALIRGGVAGALDRLALAAGIAPEWESVDSKIHIVGDDTRRALLAALGLPAATEGEARDTLERFADETQRRRLPYTVTAWEGETPVLEISVEKGFSRRPLSLIVVEDGGEPRRLGFGVEDGELRAAAAPDGREHQVWRVNLPASLPIGRHTILHEEAPEIPCLLTVAPRTAYLPPVFKGGARHFGVAAQLYSLRGAADQGIGDFSILSDLISATAHEGGAAVFINPLHVLFSTDRGRASPYQPSDRRFLDPIYLNVGALGEGLDATRARALFAASAAQFIDASMSERVQYRAVWAAKQGVLERRFDDFADTMNDKAPSLAVDAFARYVAAGGAALRRFAIFEAIAETFPGQSWRQWPDGLADVDSTAVEEFAREHRHRVRFHQYLQYLCDAQFGAAAAAGKAAGIGVGVVRDLAIGASPDGAEVWTQPDLFVKGVSVGAPPDPLAPEGQIWGLPPMNPHGLRVAGFAPFADLLSANMRHAGGLRIDHAMGLKRLFWVPDGAKGEDGAYIDYPFRDLRAQTTLQSRRSECMVVGEDLGTVPPDFREPMAEAGIQGYRVLLLERNGVGFNPSSWYPAQSVACISTHDLPTFCGWWDGEDLKERHLLGMPGSADLNGALAIRETEKTKLAETLVAEKLIEGPADTAKTAELMMPAAHAFVAGSPAALVAVQADDLAAERIAVNLPGTSNERPNWRRKLDISVPGLLRRQGAQAVLDAVRKARSAVKPTGEDS